MEYFQISACLDYDALQVDIDILYLWTLNGNKSKQLTFAIALVITKGVSLEHVTNYNLSMWVYGLHPL